jgi:ribonuclease HI
MTEHRPGGDASAACENCGALFTPDPDLMQRYPGWLPRRCPECFRRTRAEVDPAGSAGPQPRPARTPSRRGTPARPLTLAQVLERYSDGPSDGVFTDGSATPNPGPGGWGAVYVVDGQIVAEDHGNVAWTTNNRMELEALRRGVELVPPGTAAVVYSDSNLAVRSVTEWAAGWEARGWTRKTGAVENLDLVRPLFELLRTRPEIQVRWIKAHTGNRWNEYADSLASAYAREEL